MGSKLEVLATPTTGISTAGDKTKKFSCLQRSVPYEKSMLGLGPEQTVRNDEVHSKRRSRAMQNGRNC
jgi:hypothetical protein